MKDNVYDVGVLGSGPAGLTAAIYTSRANLSTLLVAGDKWGGQLMLTTEVENFPGFPDGIMGPRLMENMRQQAVRFGTEVIMKKAVKIAREGKLFQINDGELSYQVRAVILAMGADTKWLEVPGESKLIGRGISSCAPCDAAFFRNKRVYVVGGGDSAMEEALFLTKFASEVVIVHRRDAFRASKIMVDRIASNEKISTILDTEIIEVRGGQTLESVVLRTSKARWETEIDLDKRNKGELIALEGDFATWHSQVDGVFVAIGHVPNSAMVRGLVEVDEKGYILDGSDLVAPKEHYRTMTSIEGVFVAGDIHDYIYKQAVTAAASGCMAALDCEKWLEGQH